MSPCRAHLNALKRTLYQGFRMCSLSTNNIHVCLQALPPLFFLSWTCEKKGQLSYYKSCSMFIYWCTRGEHKLNSATLWQNFAGYIINVCLPAFIESLCIYKPVYPFLKCMFWTVYHQTKVTLNKGDFTPGPFCCADDLLRVNLHTSLGSFCVHTALLWNETKLTPSQGFPYTLMSLPHVC